MQRWERRQHLASAFGGACAVLIGVWAFLPLPDGPTHPETLSAQDTQADATSPEDESLDLNAFAADIWNPPPPPPPEPPPAAERPQRQAPPPKLQLIGITRDTAASGLVVLRAALYDPDADRIHLVASGDRIGSVQIEDVERDTVILSAGNRSTSLTLREDQR